MKVNCIPLPIILTIFIFILVGCEKQKLDLKFYDVEVYSMPIDEEATAQEVIVSLKSEGFKVIKEEGNYKFHIGIEVDLVRPDKEVIDNIAKIDSVGIQKEKFDRYVNLELSFILDNSYPTGKYELIIRGNDLFGDTFDEIKQEFVLD